MPQTSQSINALTPQQIEGITRVPLVVLVRRFGNDADVEWRVRLSLFSALQRRCEEWARKRPSEYIIKTLDSIGAKLARNAGGSPDHARHICHAALVEVLIDRHPEADEAAKQWDGDPDRTHEGPAPLVIAAVRQVL